MTTTLTVVALATPAAGLLAAITLRIREAQPIAWLRFTFGADRSQDWAKGELTRSGRHALNVAPGSRAQVQRWGQDTEALPRITDEAPAEVS